MVSAMQFLSKKGFSAISLTVRKQGKGKGGNICCEREKEIRGKRDELQQANKAERGEEIAMRKKK
jgi:hypothetical protein